MATKKIIDLTLRTDFDDSVSLPADDSSQTWRVTGAQIKTWVQGIFTASLVDPKVTKLTTAGTGSWSKTGTPKYIRVRMVGGGGGGSGAGNAGGSQGTAGTNSYFRVGASPDILIANGGAATTGNLGGVGGAYTINTPAVGTGMSGGDGQGAAVVASGSVNCAGGQGAQTPFGGGGAGGQGASSVGTAAKTNTGSGGGGGGATGAYSGGGGSAGGFVDAIITSPAATYAYQVGAKGTGGAASGSGSAGGNGADGYIEITEYYQ